MPSEKNNYLALCIFDLKSDKYYQFNVEPWMLSSCARDLKFSGLLENNKKVIDSKIFFKPVMREDSESLCKGFILNCDDYSKEYGLEVFGPLVSRYAQQLLINKYVNDLADLSYGLAVNVKSANNRGENNQLILSTNLELTITEKSLLSIVKGKNGQYEASKDHLPIFMDKKIEKAMIKYVMLDTSRERAGFLTGELCQDPETKNMFLVCSGHISMREIENEMDSKEHSSITHFQFNPEFFIKATRILAVRDTKKIIVGWYHSHPWHFCTDSKSIESQSSVFFSQDDVQVMESAFSSPYHIGIVIGNKAGSKSKPVTQMYGWQDGMVKPVNYSRVNFEKISME